MYRGWNCDTQIHEPVSHCEKAESRHNFQSRSALWAVSNTTLTLQRSFTNSPPLFVPEEWNCKDEPLRNSYIFKGFPWCLPCQSKPTETVIQGKVHWSLGLEGWPSRRLIFIRNTRWGKVFLPVTDARQKWYWQLWYFLLVAKDSYTYYVTLVWFCNVVLWDISLLSWVRDLCS